jgi:hypothetical protein
VYVYVCILCKDRKLAEGGRELKGQLFYCLQNFLAT